MYLIGLPGLRGLCVVVPVSILGVSGLIEVSIFSFLLKPVVNITNRINYSTDNIYINIEIIYFPCKCI